MTVKGRQTAKAVQATKTASELGLSIPSERTALYEALQKAGYNWDGKTKTWDSNNPWTGSAFEDAHGRSSGHIKLRLQAHPNDLPEILPILAKLKTFGLVIAPTNEGRTYPNRTGVGVRMYFEGFLE